MSEPVNPRWQRTEKLLGAEGLRRLQKASVMIVGLGAVGGYALEALARAGVGRLILVDCDTFEISNINRQILALKSTLGRRKTEVARERVLEINPGCEVEILDIFVNADNLPDLLAHPADYVIDAIDSLNAKCCLIQELCARGIPFVTSMGAALKTDPASIRCAPLSQSKNDALARLVRQRLRRRGVELGQIRCVYSEELTDLPENAALCDPAAGPSGHILGSLPTITAIFGLTLANYVITDLAGYKSR